MLGVAPVVKVGVLDRRSCEQRARVRLLAASRAAARQTPFGAGGSALGFGAERGGEQECDGQYRFHGVLTPSAPACFQVSAFPSWQSTV